MKFSLQSNDIKNKIILLVGVVFSGTLILCSENNDVTIPLFSMIFLSFMAMIIVKFNIFHPYVWYSSFFTIYSISYPLLYRMEYINYGYTKDLIFMQWLALATLLLTLPSKA
ncbi:TPA: oligosaccharide repeat unit polymerase, partial [Streptococcus pneumoniae]|nr:oligosaccharide repeat unit polymerase [Streptococcus pneumoniae]